MSDTTGTVWISGAKQIDALDALLCDRPSDEGGGANGALGFTFQQWWATLTAVELFVNSDDDFAVVLELKEDVAILDSSSSPSIIEFCQIKKNERDGGWVLKDLHRAGKKLKEQPINPSVLAKLYKRRLEFNGHPTKLRFVSNLGVKVPLPDGSIVAPQKCKINQLDETAVDVLKKAIATQLCIDADQIDLKKFELFRTNLPLGDQHLMVGGLISDHCNTARIPFPIGRPTLAARVLVSEVQDRASNTTYAISFHDLQPRLLSRADILKILSNVAEQSKAPLSEVLDKAIERLDAENYDFRVVQAIRQQRTQVCAAAVDRTNLVFRNIATALSAANERLSSKTSVSKLGELMNMVVLSAKVENKNDLNVAFGYPEAVALLILYEAINVNIFITQAGTKLKEEE